MGLLGASLKLDPSKVNISELRNVLTRKQWQLISDILKNATDVSIQKTIDVLLADQRKQSKRLVDDLLFIMDHPSIFHIKV